MIEVKTITAKFFNNYGLNGKKKETKNDIENKGMRAEWASK